MPETLCIAELQDGRRALAYINPEEKHAQLVLILRPDDLVPRSMRITPTPGIPVVDMHTGEVIGTFTAARDLHIPAPPPPPRITADDLIQRGAQLAQGQPIPPEDQLLKDILDLRDEDPEDPEAPATT